MFRYYFQITGTWYVIEILHHRTDEKTYGRDLIEVTTCPTITLKYPAESDTELKLYWNEDEGDVDYRFRINETTSPGKWESAGAQTGKTKKEHLTFSPIIYIYVLYKYVNTVVIPTFDERKSKGLSLC